MDATERAKLREQVQRWSMNRDGARVNVKLGVLRALLDELDRAIRSENEALASRAWHIENGEKLKAERDEARAEVARYWTSGDMRPWVELAESKGLGHFGKKLLGMFNRAMKAEDSAREESLRAEHSESALSAMKRKLEKAVKALEPFAKEAATTEGIDGGEAYSLPSYPDRGLTYFTVDSLRLAREARSDLLKEAGGNPENPANLVAKIPGS